MQLLTTTGGVYDPAADAVLQDELAAETAAAAVREAEQEEARRAEARADDLQALAEAGALHRAAPRRGDEDARDALARRPGRFFVQDGVDGWLAHALAEGEEGGDAGPALPGAWVPPATVMRRRTVPPANRTGTRSPWRQGGTWSSVRPPPGRPEGRVTGMTTLVASYCGVRARRIS